MQTQYDRDLTAFAAAIDQDDAAAGEAIGRLGPEARLALHVLLTRRDPAPFRTAPDHVFDLLIWLATLGWSHALASLARSESDG